MEKLVFDYTYCDFSECWEWNIPFEYKSKENFLTDVLYNPMMLNNFGITVHQFQVDEGKIYEKEWFENMENKDLPGINPQTFKIILDERKRILERTK